MRYSRLLASFVALTLLSSGIFATEKPKFKIYGFFRNFTAFDTRESHTAAEELFYIAPKDEHIVDGEDLNATPSFRSIAITSRLGLDLYDFQYGKTKITGRIEVDFNCKSGSTAIFRLRQVYMDFAWEHLEKNSVSLRLGQAWHPMAVDMPFAIGLESGANFAAYTRTPQLMGNYRMGNGLTFTVGVLGQMQYRSTGPYGSSTDYARHSLVPEVYAGVTFKSKNGFMVKTGVDVLTIKPRWTDGTRKVDDMLTTVSPYAYVQYSDKLFKICAKSLFASAGEHLTMRSGYGVCGIDDDGSWEYTPMRSSASFLSVSYGSKWQAIGSFAYLKYFGTEKAILGDTEEQRDANYFCNNAEYKNMSQMWRISPAVQYTIGRMEIALEYNLIGAEYGDALDSHMMITENRRWVLNHRIVSMVKFSF